MALRRHSPLSIEKLHRQRAGKCRESLTIAELWGSEHGLSLCMGMAIAGCQAISQVSFYFILFSFMLQYWGLNLQPHMLGLIIVAEKKKRHQRSRATA